MEYVLPALLPEYDFPEYNLQTNYWLTLILLTLTE